MSDTLLSVRPVFGSWNHGPLHIQYGLGVLEEIRRIVQEGFHKIPHGGVETGGVLYGSWNGTVLTIAAWRPLSCEHSTGPRFELSGPDEAALAAQISAETPELENHQVVGWFASHSRGALQLRGSDLDLHAKFFPEAWQPILLLCASRNQPMQAAFYSRAEGTLAAGAEVRSFEVIPNPTAVPRRTGKNASGRSKGEAANPVAILATQVGSEPASLGSTVAAPVQRSPDEVRASAMAASAPPVQIPGASQAPFFEDEAAPRFTAPVNMEKPVRWNRLAWGATWLAMAAAGTYAIPRIVLRAAAAPPVLEVQLNEVSAATPGQMTVRWEVQGDPDAVLRDGEVHVADSAGGPRETFKLASANLRSGTLTFWRASGHVEVDVAIRSGSGDPLVGKANFGQDALSPELNKELGVLRAQLREYRTRGLELERQIAQKQGRSRR